LTPSEDVGPPERAEQPGPAETPEPSGTAEQPEPHTPDGLDLARALTRATAGATPRQRRKQRSRDKPTTERVSGAHPDDRDPQPIGGEVARLVEERGWELDLRMRGVFARWPELVGEQVAGHCAPESFVDGRLVVRAGSTAWATQLRLLVPTLLRRLNEELGHGTVSVIDVLGPHGPSWKKGPRSARDGRGPRDTYG